MIWMAWWMGRRPGRNRANPSTWPTPLLGGLAAVAAVVFFPAVSMAMLIPFVARASGPEISITKLENLGLALAFAGAGARPGWFTADTMEVAATALGPPLRAALLLAAAPLLLWRHIPRARLRGTEA